LALREIVVPKCFFETVLAIALPMTPTGHRAHQRLDRVTAEAERHVAEQ
jgi:hypothetical protein